MSQTQDIKVLKGPQFCQAVVKEGAILRDIREVHSLIYTNVKGISFTFNEIIWQNER